MPLTILGQNSSPQATADSAPEGEAPDAFVKEPLHVSRQQFLSAIHNGDMPQVRGYLERQPELAQSRDAAGMSAILLAALQGEEDIVALLREQPGMALDLCEAAAVGDSKRLAELLADPRCDPAGTSADGSTCLGLAAFFGHPAVVEQLLSAGADSRQVSDNLQRTTALHHAVAQSDETVALEISRRLLAAGADVDAVQAGGFTPLHQAASRGRRRLVELLLAQGAERRVESDQGQTAADLARRKGHDLDELLAVPPSQR